MCQLVDSQMCKIADFDCFSQVFFERLEDYKRIKLDLFYKEHLVGDHENFADTKRSMARRMADRMQEGGPSRPTNHLASATVKRRT